MGPVSANNRPHALAAVAISIAGQRRSKGIFRRCRFCSKYRTIINALGASGQTGRSNGGRRPASRPLRSEIF